MSITAMKQALEALEYHTAQTRPITQTQDAITALRAAIEQAEKQEPVAWIVEDQYGERLEWAADADIGWGNKTQPLYTTPTAAPVQDENAFFKQFQTGLMDVPPAAPVQEPVATYTCGVCGVSMRMEVPNVATPRVQEPVAEVKAKTTGGNVGIATVIHEIYSPHREPLQPGDKLYAGYRWIGWDIEQVWSERIFGIDMRFENVQDALKFRDKLDEATQPAAQRQWVGLTDEEKHGIYRRAGLSAYHLPDSVVQYQYDRCLDDYVSAIEAKLREKNGGQA